MKTMISSKAARQQGSTPLISDKSRRCASVSKHNFLPFRIVFNRLDFLCQRWILTTILLMVVFNISLKAQKALLTEVEVSNSDLTPTQIDKYQRILAQETVVSTKFITLSNLSEAQNDGWLTLKMPDKICSALVKAKYVSSYENGDYYWYGEVISKGNEAEEDCECYDGFVNIIKLQGEIIGTISVDEDKYEIQSIGEGGMVLVKKDVTDLNLGCGNEDAEGKTSVVPQSTATRSNGNCPVKVLALYTKKANDAVANIQNTIKLSVAQTNQSFRNSLVSECDLELKIVDIQEIQFKEGFNAVKDRDALIINANVQALRNNAEADIVLVYTDGNYGGTLGTAGTLTLQAENALCVIEAAEATTEFTTAHEVAHLFGCRHEKPSDKTGPFEHAHEFKTGCWPFRKYRNTIMFSVATGRTIQHYSNPDVKYKKKPTGETNSSENWRQLKDKACIVANFRDDGQVSILNANISGDGYSCPCFVVGLTALVSGGTPGPYQYSWRTSTDGFNWSIVQSTGSVFSVTLPCEVGEGIYVRLTVISSDGQQDDSFRFIEAADTWPGQQGGCPKASDSNNNIENINNEILFPNPVKDILTLLIDNDSEMPSDILIVDVWGRLMAVKPKINHDERTIQISTANLLDGMYFLNYGQKKVLKFVKSSN